MVVVVVNPQLVDILLDYPTTSFNIPLEVLLVLVVHKIVPHEEVILHLVSCRMGTADATTLP